MSEDPTSWYCWWAIKDLQLREIWGKLSPQQKRRKLWICAVVFLVEVPLMIYICTVLNRIAGK
jgi:hypothetical protein